MTLEDLMGECHPSLIEKLSDAELEAITSPFWPKCRPSVYNLTKETNKNKPKTPEQKQFQSKLNIAKAELLKLGIKLK